MPVAALSPNDLAAALEAVRRTNTAHASAIDALERAFDAEKAQLANDRQAFEDDRAAFIKETDEKLAREEELQQRMRAAAPPPDDLVKLNVGGARFETSRAVLTKVEDSMLGRMFGRCDTMLQADPLDGSIFIDRDGERFAMLLDFLRGDPPDGMCMQRAIRALPEAAQEAMMHELDYFGLEAAVFGVRPWTDEAAFRPGPEMSEERSWFAAVLAGGRVVVFGGSGDDTTEVLDTQAMAFTPGPSMLTGRSGCAAVQIDEERVLVVGGLDANNNDALNTTEIFHLSTRAFTPGPHMQTPRNLCAAVTLDARRILVVGGNDGVSRLSSTEILSLDTMAFAPGPDMATTRNGCAAVALDEHRIIVAGGKSDSGRLNTTEILDIRTMAFTPGPSMSSERDECVAVSVDAQHVLLIGGRDTSDTALATTELLDVAALKFAPGPTMQAARYAFAAARLDTAGEPPRIVVVGGADDAEAELSSTEILDVVLPGASTRPVPFAKEPDAEVYIPWWRRWL